jgi:PAS domain S-box-containing protein
VTGDLLTIERADGTRRYLYGNAAPLRDQAGAVRGAVGAFQDITEIRLTEEALRESEARFRLVADNAPVLIWMSAPDGRRVYFNRRWLDFRGRTFEAEAGHGWEVGLHPDDRPKYVDACHRAFAARSTIDVEYRLLRADGRYRWLMDCGVRRLDAAGGFSGYIGSCVDITERKAADGHLRELSGRLIDAQERARARLARDLHDDLGQRMTLMQLSIARFARSTEGLSLEAHRQLHTILQVVEKITVDIQGLSHSLHPSTLDSLGLVTALRSVCREFGEHSRLNVRFSYQQVPRDVAPETCLSLFRVAQEALTNVVKHSGVGEATLDLSCDGDSLTLVVSDSGVGFDLDRTDQIGAPGLGLSSMRERLFLIGGELHVSSTLGRGTSIRATVRVRPEAKPADPPDVATEASAR